MGWRRGELWFEVDVAWFGEGAVAPAVAGLALPPLPSFGPTGLHASRQRREAWRRRRRTRATVYMMLPAVMVPPALFRSAGAGAEVLAEDPPSLTFRIDPQTREPAREPSCCTNAEAVARDPNRPLEPHIRRSSGTTRHRLACWWSGSLIAGTQLPVEGPNWVTWNPVTDSVPNAPRRLHGNERTIRTIVTVIDAYRAENPRAPRVVVGDISYEGGGPMDAHVSHQNGLDVDIYYPRLDGALRAPSSPEAVDRRLAQDLLDRFLDAGATMVFVGYRTGLHGPARVVVPYPRHENHMHVRFPARHG